ncbi:hypothetical protein BaRGS_00008979, partial [Batillaria attramentaria]
SSFPSVVAIPRNIRSETSSADFNRCTWGVIKPSALKRRQLVRDRPYPPELDSNTVLHVLYTGVYGVELYGRICGRACQPDLSQSPAHNQC